jgi:hypothetical protein
MRMILSATLLFIACSDQQRRDATDSEIRAAAAKCLASVTRLGQHKEQKRSGPSNRELGIPGVFVVIDSQNDTDFTTKANCLDRELNKANAYSSIYGPNGEDLLVSSGKDRIF